MINLELPEEIKTDRGRIDSYTYELASNQNLTFSGITYKGIDQRFSHFKKTNGYTNSLLDGIWLRSPYLHNGSVPTLRDLLQKPEARPKAFYRGYDRVWQLDQGYKRRKTIYNLYHILNHFNLFSGGYSSQANRMIEQII